MEFNDKLLDILHKQLSSRLKAERMKDQVGQLIQ